MLKATDMRSQLLALLVVPALLAGGCSSRDLASPTGGDAGCTTCGPDMTSPTCGAINAAAQQWIDAHQACTQDSDCSYAPLECGLGNGCVTIINNDGAAQLQSYVQEWNQAGCMMGVCECPLLPAVGCDNGVCGVRQDYGQIGDPCANDAECASHQCATTVGAITFPSGYCTITQCNTALRDPCPDGSTCQAVDGSNSLCLKNCDPGSNQQQCRDGYGCCWGAGPPQGMAWCAPGNSQLCLAN